MSRCGHILIVSSALAMILATTVPAADDAKPTDNRQQREQNEQVMILRLLR